MATSSGFSSGRLRCGLTTAYFHDSGNSPVFKKVDRRVTRNCASDSITSLRSHNGRGSRSHCLFGDDRTISMTSSTVGAVNSARVDSACRVYSDGRASDVRCLMAETFLSGYWWKSSSEKHEDGRRPAFLLPRSMSRCLRVCFESRMVD